MGVETVWNKVLKVKADRPAVVIRMGSLFSDLDRTIDRIDDSKARRLYDEFCPSWLESIHGPGGDWNGMSEGLVDRGALVALEVLADIVAPYDYPVTAPDEAVIDDLRASLVAALADVRTAESLPSDVRSLVVARVHDMLWALDHLAVTGADGVVAATERLATSLNLNVSKDDLARPVLAKVRSLAGVVWSAFRISGPASDSIEGWQKIFGSIGS